MPRRPTIPFLSQHQDEKSYGLELNEDICCTHHRLIARIPGTTISERNPRFDKCLNIPHPPACTVARRDLAIFNKCSTNN